MAELKDSYSPRGAHDHRTKEMRSRLAYRESGLDYLSWRTNLSQALKQKLGLPLSGGGGARHLWSREETDGRIERWDLKVEKGAEMPMYLAVPHEASDPVPFIICLQGHGTGMHVSLAVDREDECTPIEVAGDRDLARQCLANGVGALCIEQRAFGLRRDLWSEEHSQYGKCSDTAMRALVLGRTLLGERVHDVSRALAFLSERPECDSGKIGIMGNSAGGTVSLYSIALLKNIAFAVASSCFCLYRESWLRASFCPCGYVPELAELADLPDILGLAAPRPAAVIVGREDRGFPPPAVEEAFERLQAIYAAAGHPENCRLVFGDEGHRFYAQPAWKFIREVALPGFFNVIAK
jgi:dienelactone hydrolase